MMNKRNYIEIVYDTDRLAWHMVMYFNGERFRGENGYFPLMFFDKKNDETFWQNLKFFRDHIKPLSHSKTDKEKNEEAQDEYEYEHSIIQLKCDIAESEKELEILWKFENIGGYLIGKREEIISLEGQVAFNKRKLELLER